MQQRPIVLSKDGCYMPYVLIRLCVRIQCGYFTDFNCINQFMHEDCVDWWIAAIRRIKFHGTTGSLCWMFVCIRVHILLSKLSGSKSNLMSTDETVAHAANEIDGIEIALRYTTAVPLTSCCVGIIWSGDDLQYTEKKEGELPLWRHCGDLDCSIYMLWKSASCFGSAVYFIRLYRHTDIGLC